jgi:DNA-binding transcriptional MerR regulator/methylmalonyl-CoA mutase cobalamin-binding subunit
MEYTVKAAARATGVSESRLRTWERRYGIPSPGRSHSGRRLYTEADLAVIRRMAAFVEAGVSAHEAAEAARSGVEAAATTGVVEHPLALAVAEASERFDETGLVRAIRTAVSEMGWPDAIDRVVFPGLKRVGRYWETAVFPPANEHFASEVVRFELAAAIQALEAAASGTPCVVMACPQDERHDIGLMGLALLLKMHGIRTVYLGADVPAQDLVTAYEAAGADAICLSATTAVGLASLVRASRMLVAARRLQLFLGGPATSSSGLEAAGIRLPDALSAAAALIERSLKQRA